MNFRRLFHRDRDLEQEVQAHFEMATRDRIERGESPEDAASSARREFGNRTLVKEVTREMWGWSSFERLLQDLRYTVRVLRKSPGFTAVAILSIALGIGVNTAIFSLIDAVMLKSLAVRNPVQLVMVGDPTRTGALSDGPGRADLFAYPFFERFRARNQVFSDVYASGRCEHMDISLANGERVGTDQDRIRGRFVSGNFFSLLGVHAVIGREFTEEEVRVPGSAPVVEISHGFWERTFGENPGAIGQKLVVNGFDFTIIGVMPPDFSGDIVGAPTDIWFPVTMQAQANPGHDFLRDPQVSWLLLMGRLKPGVSLKQADASTQVLGHRIFAELYKGKNSNEGFQKLLRERIEVTPGARGFSRMRSDFKIPLLTLMGIVALILLICCANVANLQLARAAARAREMSVRLAVGAGKTRLVRQLFTESLILAIAGGGLGLFFAIWGSHLLLWVLSAAVPIGLDVRLDATVLIFTAATAILASLLFGLAPAIQATRVDLISALKENKSGQKAFARGFGKALIVSQIVFSLVLLVAAGWFIRTLQNLEEVDLGYVRNGLLLAELDFKTAGYKDSRVNQLIHNLLEKVQRLPGVEAVSASENGLFSGTDSEGNDEIEGFVAHSLEDRINNYDRVGPDYFSTIGARIIAGRGVGPQDTENAPKVVVINEKMAQFYFPHQNPIGRHIFDTDDPSGKDKIALTIIGVVRDVKESYLRKPAPRRFYSVIFQHRAADPIDGLRLEIRTHVPSGSLVASVRRAIKNVDPKLPVTLQTADDLIGDAVAQEKLVAKLSSLFGLLAVVLAAIGLYGVLSYLTVRRTTEIGVRMALGARRRVVMAMVVRETLWLIIPGLAIGIVISILLARLLANILFGLSPFDPVSSFSAAVVITIAAALATYLPARRASKIDPMTALRYE